VAEHPEGVTGWFIRGYKRDRGGGSDVTKSGNNTAFVKKARPLQGNRAGSLTCEPNRDIP